MSSGYTKGTPASSQIIWLEEKVKEQEENIDAIMQINARLRDEKRETNAEIKRLRDALRQVLLKDERGNPWHTYDELRMIAMSALKIEDE